MSKQSKKRAGGNAKGEEYVLAYSTDPMPEKRCVQCCRPLSECGCALAKIKSMGPLNPTVRIEKKGRGGKSVTVLARLPNRDTFLKELCAFLKKTIGTGGTHYIKEGEGFIEIQGEWRDRAMELAKNYGQKF